MKKDKTLQKDNIKDKYTKKLGFFKKLQVKFNIFNEKDISKDILTESKIALIIFLEIALYGLMGSLALSLFGVSLGVLTFFGIGSLLWLIENKFIDSACRLLSSVKLVEIKR